MHTLTFYPLGNADTTKIDLENGKKLLIDYAATRDASNPLDRRCNLPNLLRDDLVRAGRDYYDMVAFTHLDCDHIDGSTDFFYLEHAATHQGQNRIKINELWVPAAAIVEEGCEDEARTLRAEARYRLKQGERIRVFSRPQQLEGWLKSQGLSLASRAHLITDAGQVVPGFRPMVDGVEFFVHSPFASRLEDGALIDRNQDALVLHATFTINNVATRAFFGSDADHESLSDIVKITCFHKREERLQNDIVKLCHHCSYLSIGPEKGKEKTAPVPEVKWLFDEQQLQAGAVLVSTSCPVPSNDDDNQPPHRQAANYYKERRDAVRGEFIVTMEHPTESKPEPLVIEITGGKARRRKAYSAPASVITSAAAPRAGRHG